MNGAESTSLLSVVMTRVDERGARGTERRWNSESDFPGKVHTAPVAQGLVYDLCGGRKQWWVCM